MRLSSFYQNRCKFLFNNSLILFQDEAAAASVCNHEKAILLCLALKWLSGKRLEGKALTKSSEDLAELESQMWLCVIHDRLHSTSEVCTPSLLNCSP